MQAKSHLQSIENAYLKLVDDQYANIKQKKARKLSKAKRSTFALTLFYQVRNAADLSSNGNDLFDGNKGKQNAEYRPINILQVRLISVSFAVLEMLLG